MNGTEFEHAIVFWSFGRLTSDQLPQVASKAIEQGIESSSLVEVACAECTADPDLHRLFEKALCELGRVPISRPDAGRILSRDYARQICNAEISPIEGARAIWKITLDCDDLVSELGIFGGRASEYEDLPALRDKISEMIVSEAKRVVVVSQTSES